MTDSLLDLALHARERLASALESGVMIAPFSPPSLRAILGNSTDVIEVARALSYLERSGISGAAAGVFLRTMNRVASRIPSPDLVWSGPEVAGLHARETRRVFEELIGSAVRSLWVSTYVYFDGPKAFELLARRMDEQRNLQVTLLLNIQRKWNETTSVDHLVRRFADQLWKFDWPGTSRPRVFFDPRALSPAGPEGVLHAKALVADEEALFVTSANLTEAALDRNFEVGLLVRDRSLAASLITHFQILIDKELLKPLPIS